MNINFIMSFSDESLTVPHSVTDENLAYRICVSKESFVTPV